VEDARLGPVLCAENERGHGGAWGGTDKEEHREGVD